MERRLSAILAADIAGYSRLMGEDEDGTVQALQGHQTEVLPLVAKFGGRIIDTAGDGILAEFPSVIAAVECATDIQVTMARRNAEVPENRRMLFRIGINLGDLIHDGSRIYGDGINVAARLEGIAEPGGICISRQVFEQVDRALDMVFNALGPRNLKNIARPVDVYAVDWEAAPATVPAGPRESGREPAGRPLLPYSRWGAASLLGHRRGAAAGQDGQLDDPPRIRSGKPDLAPCVAGTGQGAYADPL